MARRSAVSRPRSTSRGDTWPLLGRILRSYIFTQKRDLFWAIFAMILTAVALAIQAHLIQPLFDNGLMNRSIGVLNTIIFTLLGLTVVRGIASFYQSYFMEAVGQKLVVDIQNEMYSHTLKQSLSFFADNPTGTLTSRFLSDLFRLKSAITQIFSSGLRDFGTIIGLFANMLFQDVQLTLLTLIVLPATLLPMRKFGRLSRKYSRVNQEASARLNHLLTQSLVHIRQVQSFTNEENERQRLNQRVAEVLANTLKSVRVRAASGPIVETIGTIAIGLLLLYAARRITNGSLTAGEFASFIASLLMVVRPLKGLTNFNNNLQEGLAAAQRALELIDSKILVQNAPGAVPLTHAEGDIVFDNVTFRYPDGSEALKNLSFTIPAGKTVAFVGPSGAGKTSLLNLLPRFYDVAEGRILMGGQDIKGVTLESLRRHIALVSQDIAIFDESVTANLTYGTTGVTTERLHAAARAAAAEEFINALPQGYDTVLGENGTKLSGGQKQRIAIARALIKDAPVLLLDEATASLDTQSERQVQSALEQLMRGRTTLVVAHRLSTIVHADIIMVLQNGQLVEQGNHDELLREKGLYSRLWHMQVATDHAA